MPAIPKPIKTIAHHTAVIVGAVVLTFAFFLILPLMQQISKPPVKTTQVGTTDVANIPPPPPPPEEEPPEEEEPEPEPPKLEQEVEPLDLSQLELALNPGTGAGALQGDFSIDLSQATEGGGGVDELFSLADLDQKPRPVYQPGPNMSSAVRRQTPGKVFIIFVVNKQGRVEQAKVQKSSHPVFEQPALAAVKQWRFEAGKRNGEPVRFRMRVPITFPES